MGKNSAAAERSIMLIVDDVEINRFILRSIFEEEYHCAEASNGREALEFIKENEKHIVALLLDVMMPKMDGFELLRELNKKKMLEEIPVFLITADASEKTMYEGYELGVRDIIEKPFIPYFLKHRVNSVVELYQTRKKLKDTVRFQSEIIREKVREVKQLNSSMIETLALAIEFRSGETGAHVQNIRKLTYDLLWELRKEKYPGRDFTDGDLEDIADAAILHDIGKIAIPDMILNKPGKLTSEEYEIMKTHSLKGAELIGKMPNMETTPLFQYAYDICRHHHERWDGNGYPDGLKGEENTIWSQAVALADVYDALTSKRCYKDAFSLQTALKMIEDGQCGSFNPKMIETLKKVLRSRV